MQCTRKHPPTYAPTQYAATFVLYARVPNVLFNSIPLYNHYRWRVYMTTHIYTYHLRYQSDILISNIMSRVRSVIPSLILISWSVCKESTKFNIVPISECLFTYLHCLTGCLVLFLMSTWLYNLYSCQRPLYSCFYLYILNYI